MTHVGLRLEVVFRRAFALSFNATSSHRGMPEHRPEEQPKGFIAYQFVGDRTFVMWVRRAGVRIPGNEDPSPLLKIAEPIAGFWARIIKKDLRQEPSGKNFLLSEGEAALAAQAGAAMHGVAASVVDAGKDFGCDSAAGKKHCNTVLLEGANDTKQRAGTAASLVNTTNTLCGGQLLGALACL